MEKPEYLDLDEYGHEVPDPTPLRMPSGFKRPETLAEQVRRLVRTTLSRQAEEAGFETFEEAEDFDVDDDFDPSTPYETFFDPMLGRDVTAHDFLQHKDRYRQEVLDRTKNYYRLREQADLLEGKVNAVQGREAPADAHKDPKGPPA